MKSFKRVNNITGWIVFLFALVVYTLTLEATASFWDCGEFISGAWKLQVVHPPGAPLFIMLGRIFMLFAKSAPSAGFMVSHTAAWYVNFLSGLTTAFAVLFFFWITTHYARKLVAGNDEPTKMQTALIMAAGLIGGACCTFLDSIWFSAVEGEVYATSIFFMMLVFWCMIKWENDTDIKYRDRWLVLAMYLVGLSSGVHLLSFLALPAMALVYYFKKYKPTIAGFLTASVLGVILLGFFFKGIVTGLINLIADFELLFTNSFGMGFGTGFEVFMLLVIVLLAVGLYWSQNKGKDVLQWVVAGSFVLLVLISEASSFSLSFLIISAATLGGAVYLVNKSGKESLNIVFLSLLMALLGFSTYAIVIIRANADTPINMNAPADAFMLKSYLNREQYGDRPLLYGPNYNAYPTASADGKYYDVTSFKYHKGKTAYEKVGENIQYRFADEDMVLFPRMGSWQDDRHVTAYRYMVQPSFKVIDKDSRTVRKIFPNNGDWTKAYAEAQNYVKNNKGSNLDVKDILSQKENLQFFFSYQVGVMYWRYFMWNFSGRQNDIQGRFDNDQGRFVTGFSLIDNKVIGPQEHLPDYMKKNGAHNVYYMIPLILGLLGLYYHFKRDPESALIIMMLFLFSGILQVIYLNSPPFEPRERDYTLVGSFVTYCLWIGFGLIAIYQFIRERVKVPEIPTLLVLFALSTAAPILMGSQNWDDHDRSRRYTCRDFAINYLQSCAPNAILFTQGDNDTYPLWYAQEVEGIRTDVRIVNLSLLGVDWYIDQLRAKANDSAPIKLTLPSESYAGTKRDVTRFFDDGRVPQDQYFELKDVIGYIASDDRKKQVQLSSGEYTSYLPTKKFKIAVDSAEVVADHVVPEYRAAQIPKEMVWDLGDKNNLLKNDLVTLDIVASNLWKRPIYFAVSVSPDAYLGMEKYFQLEGLAYRVVPVPNTEQQGGTGFLATDIAYNNVMNKFKWGGIEVKDTINYTIKSSEKVEDVAYHFNTTLDKLKALNKGDIKPGATIKVEVPVPLYMDENIQRMTMNLRSNFARLGSTLADQGKKDSAKAVLDRCLYAMPQENVPYNVFMLRMPEAYYKAGDVADASLISRKMAEQYEQEINYAADLINQPGVDAEANRNMEQSVAIVQDLIRVAKQYQDKATEDDLMARFTRMQGVYNKFHKERGGTPNEDF